MAYNPLTQINNQSNHRKSDVLESLRGEIDLWLAKPNHSQKLLTTRAGMSPQMLNDIIQHRRGCSPETFEKITKALGSNGTRFVNVQVFGQQIEDQMPDIAEFENKHNQDLFELRSKSGRNHNAGSTFADKKEFSNE